MSGISSANYREAIKKVFTLTTNHHPEFENGEHVTAWLVDFSIAQRDGLASNLGSNAAEAIRGCNVHYQRNVKKVCDKVCSDERSKEVFKKIAYRIPDLSQQEDVDLAFSLLCGEKSFDDDDAQDFLQQVAK